MKHSKVLMKPIAESKDKKKVRRQIQSSACGKRQGKRS